MTLKIKILIYVLLPLYALFVGIKVYDYSRYEQQSEQEIKLQLSEKAQNYAARVDAMLRQASSAATGMADLLSIVGTVGEEEIYAALELNLRGNNLIFGSAVAYVPGAYQGRDRFGPYVFRSNHALERIDIATDAYDYTAPKWEWFNRPVTTKEAIWTKPYFDEGAGNILMVTFSAPIFDAHDVIGVVTVDVEVGKLLSIAGISESTNKHLMLADRTGTVIYDTDTDHIGETLTRSRYFAATEELRIGEILGSIQPHVIDIESEDKTTEWLGVAQVNSAHWLFMVSFSADESLRALEDQKLRVLGIVSLVLVVFTLLTWALVSRIVSPVAVVAEAADALSEGRYDAPLPMPARDETGRLTRAFGDMRNRLLARETELKDINETLEKRVDERTMELADSDRNLQLTLDNMPGALIVTGPDLTIKVISTNFNEYVNLPENFIQVGDSHEKILRYMAEHGYYGTGIDVDAVVKERIATLQKPTQAVLLDHLPDGRINAVTRRKSDTGDVITVVVDVTEQQTREEQLRDAHQQITDSVNYASHIQQAVLSGEDMLKATTADHFVLWEPRDVVGGDIYWCRPWGHGVLIITGDCTGHGVPGAFMTLIAGAALDRAMGEVPPGRMGDLVRMMHLLVQFTLNQYGEGGDSDDGLELSACFIDIATSTMIVSGARLPLFVAEGGEVTELKPTKCGIGYRKIPMTQVYEESVVDLKDGQTFYMVTDGVIDQVGGEKRRSFGKKRLKEVILSVQNRPLAEQRDVLHAALIAYQGEEPRRDDVTVVAFVP